MSFGRVIKTAFDWVIENRSRLEDALEAMPDQQMSIDDIKNGLRNRGVQQLEVDQSGVGPFLDKLSDPNQTLTPKVLKEELPNLRNDEYKVSEIRGIDNKELLTERNALEDAWFSLDLGNQGDLSLTNIENFIDERKARIDLVRSDYPMNEAEGLAEIFETEINQAEDIKQRLIQVMQGDDAEILTHNYAFDHDAYREYALPNTDDASYFVRIYENPTVDRKGIPYGDAMNHWPGQYENGVFHVRGDDVGENVRRLQEVQSDTQNILTHNKMQTIEDWRIGGDIGRNIPDAADIIEQAASGGPINDASAEIIKETNKSWIDTFHNWVGIENQWDDVMDPIGEFPNSLETADINEIRRYMLNVATNGQWELDAPVRVKTLLNRIYHGFTVRGEGIDIVKKYIQEVNPDLNTDQVDNLYLAINNTVDDYREAIAETRDMFITKRRDRVRLRVTPKERLNRIMNADFSSVKTKPEWHGEFTKQEAALQEKAYTNAFEGISEKYNINVEGVMDGLLNSSQKELRRNLLDRVLDSDYNKLDAYADRVDELLPNSFQAGQRMKREIYHGTREGIEYIRTIDKDFPDINGAVDEITEKFKANVEQGMKDLEPLKQFPNAKDYEMPVPYIKQAYQEEVLRALEEGKTEVWLTVDPPGFDKLIRGDGPHSSYVNGKHHKQFKSIAKRFNATVVDEDGYLKMKFPAKLAAGGGGTLAISAYADTNTAEADAKALEAGFTPAEIAAFKEEEGIHEYENPLKAEQAIREGFTPEEIKKFEQEEFIRSLTEEDFAEHPGVATDVPNVEGGVDYKKLPPDVIKQVAIDLEVDPTTPKGIDAVYEEIMYRDNPELRKINQAKADKWRVDQARNDLADFIELNDYYQPFNWTASSVGFAVAHELYISNKQRIQKDIIEMGREHGYDFILGEGDEVNGLPEDQWFVNIDGNIYEANPGFFAGIAREGGEIGGAVQGGIAAGLWIDRYTRGWEATPYTRLMKFGAITAGITAGSMLGDQIDYVTAAMRQHEEYNWGVARDKAMGSAELAVLGEIGGYAVLRAGAAGWSGIRRAWNHVMNGNIDGAFDMLIRSLDITEEQAHEIVGHWEDLNQKQAPTLSDKKAWWNITKYTSDKDKEKAIAVIPGSQAGGHNIAETLAEKNPRASAAIRAETNQRAKSLVRATGDVITDEELGKLSDLDQVRAIKRARRATATDIVESINTYRKDVGNFYEVIKQQGGDLVPTGYTWDMDTVAIEPLTKDLISRIYKDGKRKTARNMLKRIDKLTVTRTFPDLIELRQLINEVRSVGKPSRAEIEAFQNIIDTIDEEIADASTKMGKDGAQWHRDWLNAKADYSEMKRLTTNALGKILERPGVSETVVAKALVKYGTALDGTYSDLVKKLPLDVQPKVENLVIDELVEQFTDGSITQFQATNFPELSIALDAYDFRWPQAKALKGVVDKFAKVYQNDIALSYVTGGITTTKFAHYLTTDPVVRAQFEIASGVFNQIKVLMGGSKGDAAALINASAKLLEDPLNPKNVQQAIDAIEGNAQLEAAIKKLQTETAAARHNPGPGGTIKVRLYEDGKGNLYTQAGDGRQAVDTTPMHRITSEDVAKKVARTDDLSNLDNVQTARLIEAGYIMIGLNDGTVIKLL
jgi:hypothetical protein